MPTEHLDFHHQTRHGSALSPELVRQLATLAWSVLQGVGRESSYLDENNRFLTAKIAPLYGLALTENDGSVACYLMELGDDAAFNLKAKRRVFRFAADDLGSPADWRLVEAFEEPDFWYNMAITDLMDCLDSHG